MKKIFILIFLMATALFADSFVGMETYPHIPATTPDYLVFQQTDVIEGGEVTTILYPTLGFPALISNEDNTMSALFRCSTEPLGVTIILSKKINGEEVVFLTKEVDTISLLVDQSICKVEVTIPAVLPATVFNLALRLVGGVTHFSRNSVGFINDGPVQFFVFADPQIEDLQAKSATSMNYNNKQYPGYSASILDYSIQEGIIGASIAQYNITPVDFITSLGDMVFGINYPKEYRDIVNFILNSEVPFFATPGNHDGYAQFTDPSNFSSDLKFDGLNYWRSFLGPVSSAFTVKDKTFIMVNTYSGTAERRASGPPIGIGDNAAVPVSNYGGFLRESEQNWIDAILKQKTVSGIFSHQLPLGLPGKDDPYTAMERFPANSVIGGLTHEEWNFESHTYDSDISDTILNETPQFNSGTRLAFSLSLYDKPISYFAGHAHVDKNLCFEKGDILVPETEVEATRDICFFQTTTASTSGAHYWGMRFVTIEDDTIAANYQCDDNAQCRPDSEENQGFQSIPTGNLWTSYHWGEAESIYRGGDGITPIVRATITNYLPQNTDIVLRFVMPANPSGYAIDDENFVIDDILFSEDQSVAYIILRGIIAAGSTPEQFYNRDFHAERVELTLKAETGTTEGLHPTILCSEDVFRGDEVSCRVEDETTLIRFAWKLDDSTMSDDSTLTFSSNLCEASCEISVRIFDKQGRFGTATTTVTVQEQPSEEPDEIPEVDNEPDEIDEEIPDETEDEDTKKNPVKTSSCTALFV